MQENFLNSRKLPNNGLLERRSKTGKGRNGVWILSSVILVVPKGN